MKLGASGLLLGAAAVNYVDAAGHFLPFATDSSEIRSPNYGRVDPEIKWQSPPHNATRLERDNWKLTCSSQHEGYECANVIDGWADTYWHSDCTKNDTENSIIVNLGSSQNVSGLTMLPRMEKDVERGQIAEHSVLLSHDGKNWDDPVAYGAWGANKGMKLAVFDPKPAQYIKLVAKSEAEPKKPKESRSGNLWTSIVDLNVYATDYTIPVEPGKGVWGPTLDLPVVPVAAAQESSGNLMLWSAWADDQFFASPGGNTFMTTWDPLKKSIVQSVVSNTEHDMFCPGISMDIDGNIVVSGGADSGRTSIYNGKGWEYGPNMKIRRGYQSSTTLSDGRIFVIGGSWSGGSKKPKNGEVYNPHDPSAPEGRSWKKLPGAIVDPMLTNDKEGRWRADNHGWLFGWKKNSVFQAGPSVAMHWFSVEDGGNVTKAGDRGHDHDSMSGNAVMFDAVNGTIITFGGQEHYDGSDGSKNAHLITIGDAYQAPKVEVAGKGNSPNGGMNFNRVFHTSVVLPDGSVFIAGGEEYGRPFLEEGVQFTPEIYYPHSDTFVPLQTNNLIRVYHSISMLQPDGTVLNGGGGLCGNCSANHYDAQVFTPPYLLNADGSRAKQPVITSVDNRVVVGGSLAFSTDSKIEDASLIRLGTATHTVNTDQRRVPLKPKSNGDSHNYQADIPDDSGIALPGYYMLFVLNSNGVPSIAKIVKVELPSRHTPTSYEVEEDYDDDEEEEEEDCDMDENMSKEEDVETDRVLAILTEKTGKFWRAWKAAFVLQN